MGLFVHRMDILVLKGHLPTRIFCIQIQDVRLKNKNKKHYF